ncbi:hypothetical protein K9N68_05520 [Kovacikia minuta CCNUW1]|uniref:hypothetical protein n=1 Tax=Kovacikia minuta TaxID=2931930 RepID=UPI001CCCA22D|nr:hypothetical protein [Kovacikia minuta]UBF27410.1 hypothetical protein K9N68_05520 [Kovacikia minuta CCNUW1]
MTDPDFDISQLDNLDYDDAEPILTSYQDSVIEQFADSPEGQAYLESYPDMGGWIANLIEYGYSYEGLTLPKMTSAGIKLVLENIFPRKITLLEPTDADDAIPELIAFWQFLKREYQFKQADAIIKYLNQLAPKFGEIMNDPANFGMAKSFMMMGHQAGFDMASQEGVNAFMHEYNTNLLPKLKEQSGDSFSPMSPLAGLPNPSAFDSILETNQERTKVNKAKQKKRRVMAKESRRQNRKKK